jgi:hypothetical protein
MKDQKSKIICGWVVFLASEFDNPHNNYILPLPWLVIDRGPNVDIEKIGSKYRFPHFVFGDNNRSSTVERPLVWNRKIHDHTTLLFRANCMWLTWNGMRWRESSRLTCYAVGSRYMRLDLVPHDAIFSNSTNSTNSDWKSTFRGVNLLGLIPTSDSELFSRSG